MSHLNEAEFVLMRPQRFKEPVHAVAGKPKDNLYAPGQQAFNDQIRNLLSHQLFFLSIS
jgi:hypothetical protein